MSDMNPMDYLAVLNAIGEIAGRLAAPDLLAPESVEIVRALNAVRGDDGRARDVLTYARDVLAAYLPNSVLVSEADELLIDIEDAGRSRQEGRDYLRLMGKAREIAGKLTDIDGHAPEDSGLARALRMADGDLVRARQALVCARGALASYAPGDPLVASADGVLDEVQGGRP